MMLGRGKEHISQLPELAAGGSDTLWCMTKLEVMSKMHFPFTKYLTYGKMQECLHILKYSFYQTLQ